MEKILVTSALPYANGPIHFGHIAGAYLPADIYVRYKRLNGDDVLFICGTDEHGVPITLSAEKQGITPKEYVDINHELIRRIFDKFQVSFDNFSRTTWPKHYELAKTFFTEAHANGYIAEHSDSQFYCESCRRFLADRYLTGACPHCGVPGVRGDECTNCGKWLESLELKNPSCKICGSTPVKRETKHWYLALDKASAGLKDWVERSTHWRDQVRGYVLSLIDKGLKERPITRDMEWGVPVPLADAKGKVLYVWFDAPIGYISATMEWAEKQGKPEAWREYWQNPSCKIKHFVGKDNIVFHCIVWPAMIMGQTTAYNLPENVPANQWLNLDGRQFSKSDGWYIDALTFFEKFSADSIRYCLAANAPETSDTEFTWRDFQLRNNSELSNIYGNFANRVLQFIQNRFAGVVPQTTTTSTRDSDVIAEARAILARCGENYEKYEARRACYEIMELGRLGNKYIDESAPWDTIKSNPAQCSATLQTAAELVALMAYCSYPVIPDAATRLWQMLGMEQPLTDIRWCEAGNLTCAGNTLDKPVALIRKIEDQEIAMEIEALQQQLPPASAAPAAPTHEPLKAEITYDDFAKLDLRVGKILEASKVEKADKLLHLKVDIGLEIRDVVAGVAASYAPEALVGRKVVVLANLAPKKLRGIMSHGMLLAGGDGTCICLLSPDKDHDLPPGTTIS